MEDDSNKSLNGWFLTTSHLGLTDSVSSNTKIIEIRNIKMCYIRY